MDSTTTATGSTWSFLIPLILFFFILWFFMLRPQKKKDNEVRKMRNSLAEGDEIVTIGGVVGKILTVKDDSIVIYVGSDKTKMEFKKWAVSEVTKKNEKAQKEETKEEAPAEEPEKKKIKKLTRKEEAAPATDAASTSADASEDK